MLSFQRGGDSSAKNNIINIDINNNNDNKEEENTPPGKKEKKEKTGLLASAKGARQSLCFRERLIALTFSDVYIVTFYSLSNITTGSARLYSFH